MSDSAQVIQVTIAGRAFRATRRTAAHLTWTIQRLKNRHPDARLHIIQTCYNVGVSASAGTHDKDAVFDVWIEGLSWWDAQKFLRNAGWAAWFRHTGMWAEQRKWHIHMISLGYTGEVGIYVPGQVDDYYRHALGLKGQHNSGSDDSWFPPDINATIFNYTKWLSDREDWFEMASKEEVKQAFREVLTEFFGDDPRDKADKPDIGRARIVHPNDPSRVTSLGHILFGTDANVRQIKTNLAKHDAE